MTCEIQSVLVYVLLGMDGAVDEVIIIMELKLFVLLKLPFYVMVYQLFGQCQVTYHDHFFLLPMSSYF